MTTLSNGTAVAVGDGGIESNATTAAPAASVAMPASSVSGAVPNDTVTPPAVTTTTAATKPASSDSGAVPNVILVPPTVATTNAVVMGTVEDPSSTLGTKKNGLTS